MKIYITTSFGDAREDIEKLCAVVREACFEDFCFVRDVENYQKVFDDPKELMQRARLEIEKSDALLVDMTEKPTGRMIEVGMAYMLGKKIIVIMKNGTQVKDTIRGVADTFIEYDTIADLTSKLTKILNG